MTAKVNSSFLKDILKLTASRVLKLGGVGDLKKNLKKKSRFDFIQVLFLSKNIDQLDGSKYILNFEYH